MVNERCTYSAFGLTCFGLGTAAFFAVIGGVPRELLSPDHPLGLLVTFAPILLSVYLAARGGVRLCARVNRTLISRYILLAFAAVAIDVFALHHGTLHATLIGLLPAAPCLLAAWRAARPTEHP